MSVTQAQVEAGLQKAIDLYEVRNLANKIPYYLSNFEMKEFVTLFTEDATIAMPWGTYDNSNGEKAAEICFLQDYGDRDDPAMQEILKGCGMIFEWGSEMLIFAEDGQTARGMWTSQGAESYGKYIYNRQQRGESFWSFHKFGIDFKKTLEGWKIWHMAVYVLYRIPCTGTWKDRHPYQGFLLNRTHCTNFPLTQPFVYAIDAMQPHDQPTPPQPYKTFSDVAPGYSWEYLPHYGRKIKNGLAEPFDFDGLEDPNYPQY